MQINDNETLIKILDCSFSTPPRPTISDAAIKLIKSLLKKDPSSRLSVAQVLHDSWFNPPNEPIITQRTKGTISSTNETICTPSDSTGQSSDLTVSKENISPERNFNNNNTNSSNNNNDSSIDASVSNTSQPRQESHNATSNSSSVSNLTIHSFRSKSPSSVNEVHDRVIAEMISQKMCQSKEKIERAIRLTRGDSAYVSSSSPCHRSPFSSSSPLPVVGESVPLNLTNSSFYDQSVNASAGDSSEVDFSYPHCNDSYIMATYNLLKDKFMREIQGIPLQATVLQEIKSGPKRGHTLPGPRKRGPGVSQAPRIGRPNANCAGKVSLDESSLRQKLQEEETQRSGNDIVPEDECVTLPLQRKCSIVSEEGSCELSGRLSDTGSDLHVLLVTSDERKVSSVPPIANKVDIVITGISTSDCPDDGEDEQVGKTGDVTISNAHETDSPTDLAAEVDLAYATDCRLPESYCDEQARDQQQGKSSKEIIYNNINN